METLLDTSTSLPPDLKPARVRFAPSPTGRMHLGSARTALYSFLLAGAMLLVTREARDEKAFPWSALTLAGLAITRPEGAAHAVAAIRDHG